MWLTIRMMCVGVSKFLPSIFLSDRVSNRSPSELQKLVSTFFWKVTHVMERAISTHQHHTFRASDLLPLLHNWVYSRDLHGSCKAIGILFYFHITHQRLFTVHLLKVQQQQQMTQFHWASLGSWAQQGIFLLLTEGPQWLIVFSIVSFWNYSLKYRSFTLWVWIW